MTARLEGDDNVNTISFNILVNDFTSVLDQTSDQVNNYNVHCLVNTDDLVLLSEIQRVLKCLDP